LRVLALALGGALLAACGGSSGSGELAGPADPPVPTPAPTAQPASLERIDWQLMTITRDGRTRDVADLDATLTFDGTGHVGGHGCNHFGGDVQVVGDRISVANLGSTQMACSGPRAELDDAMTKPLIAGATWSLEAGRLTIRGRGIDLVFRGRDAVFPTRDAQPIVTGKIGDAVYRLAWRAGNGMVSIEWESRDRPGTGFGSSGIGRPTDYDVTHLEPSASAVAGKAFVYLPAPRTVARVSWLDASGRSTDLTSYDIPAATTWRIYAGFVGATSKGGQAVSYAADGTELMRSQALPY